MLLDRVIIELHTYDEFSEKELDELLDKIEDVLVDLKISAVNAIRRRNLSKVIDVRTHN